MSPRSLARWNLRLDQEINAIIVTVDIYEGYDVNTNPAGLDYLIPTTVKFTDIAPERVEYPEPVMFNPAFADQALKVYEGSTSQSATFPEGAFEGKATIRGTVTAQAYDNQICLPSSDIYQYPLSLSGTTADGSK